MGFISNHRKSKNEQTPSRAEPSRAEPSPVDPSRAEPIDGGCGGRPRGGAAVGAVSASRRPRRPSVGVRTRARQGESLAAPCLAPAANATAVATSFRHSRFLSLSLSLACVPFFFVAPCQPCLDWPGVCVVDAEMNRRRFGFVF